MERTRTIEKKRKEIQHAGPHTGNGRARAPIDSAHDAFVGMDENGIITEWNRQAEAMFGWSRSEAVGRPLTDLIIPDRYIEAYQRDLQRFLETGEGPILNGRFELEGKHRDGHEIPVEFTIYPIKRGNSLLFCSFLHDISDRKQVTRIQATQFSVTEILAEGDTLQNVTPRLLASLCKGLGWPIGTLWIEGEDGDSLQCVGAWSIPSCPADEFKDECTNLRLRKHDGLPGRVWTSERSLWVDDIAEALPSQRISAAIKSGLRTAIVFPIKFESDVIGVVEFFHSHPRQPDELILRMMTDIGNRIALFFHRRRAEDRLTSFYQELERRVKERTEELAAANSRLQHEITERKRLYEQAQMANRIKDEFLATVSHELRTPLNVILGHSELLNRSTFSVEEARTTIQTIYRNAKAQAQIVNDLLDVSRIITGKLQLNITPIDLVSVIHAAIESVRFAAEAKSIYITTRISPTIGPIAGDFSRLQQVLWNLLSNSIKFTPKRGSVNVTLDKVESKVRLEVADNGQGIDPRFMPYLFERFHQEDASTTRKFGGLGLGLAITRHIVEAHGGTIQALSPGKGKGATFTILLPALSVRPEQETSGAASDADTDSTPLSEETISLKGCRVLVVDDEPDSRALLNLVLSRAGGVVALASSASEALELFHDFKPDVLISDISMPGEDGYSLIRKVRAFPNESGGQTPAVALTAHARIEERDRVMAAGFQKHVAKPVEALKLIRTIAALIKKGEERK